MKAIDCTSKFKTQRDPMFGQNETISMPVASLPAIHRQRLPANRRSATCESVEFTIAMMSFRIRINDRMIVVSIKIES